MAQSELKKSWVYWMNRAEKALDEFENHSPEIHGLIWGHPDYLREENNKEGLIEFVYEIENINVLKAQGE